ncbi:hypothetical protein [Paenibacillus paeoniae]|uniref:Prophage tail endopeptidase domain-containing protein n=1 Tax=Paenibacillus paeoniae TaxID=2292705 RepID=A0A371P082_9BACL|nr:hypothetical protein [Paenibacillus paeoniae]REK69347.1 hypothetical protein DX130_24615 [Paenibacillus paeoniae]
MYPISPLYESFLKRPDREFMVKVMVGDTEYDMANIVDFIIDSSLIPDTSFTIGTVILSKLTLRLRLKAEVPENVSIRPYVAFDSNGMTWTQAEIAWQEANIYWAGGAAEWLPLGEFYVDSRERTGDIWTFDCLDKLIWTEQPFISSLTYPASMQAVWAEMCQRLGYTYDSTVQIKPGYTIKTKPAGYTCRQVMGWIAGSNSASVRAGKDGQIQFKHFTGAMTPDIDMTPSDYIRTKQTNAVKTIKKVVVTYDAEEQAAYTAGTGTEDETLYIDNPLMTQSMVNDLHATINGFAYQPMEMDARGYPHLDVGDVIGYEVYEGNSWLDTITPWQNTHVPWSGMVGYQSLVLTMVLQYKGGFRMTLDAPSTSEQQSQYVVKGPLTEQVEKLNKDTVKLDRNYYGVRTSREEGLVVETEGGSGKAVFNADELSFWANGQRSLWFDIPNKKFKFKGTLEGADGTFSGTLQAGTIIGGSISGATISGGSIYGSYFATGLGTYPFVELSSNNNLIAAYGDANKYVKIESNLNNLGAPMIRFGFNGNETHLMQVGSGFYAFGPSSNMSFNFNDLSLGGNVRVSGGASKLGSHSVSPPSDPDSAVTKLSILIAALRDMGILA